MSDRLYTPAEMSIDELFAYIEQHPDKRFKFSDGELVEVSPKPLHGRLQSDLTILLGKWLEDYPIGTLHTETLHVLDGKMFIPDISVNSEKADDRNYFDVPPLLAVEIRSDSQSRASQRRKAVDYITCGTPAVLLIMPDEQIELFTASTQDNPHVYKPGQTLADIPNLPGLQIDAAAVLG